MNTRLAQLHNDIAKEEESKNRASGRGGGGTHHHGGGGGGSSSAALRPGSGDARLSANSRFVGNREVEYRGLLEVIEVCWVT